MKKHLLTFEKTPNSDEIFIHGDANGLEYFANELLKIAQEAKNGEFPHDHFFTKEWGSTELSSELQSIENKLIHHVKVFGWPTAQGAKPYAKK